MSIFSRLFYLDEEQDALDFDFLKHKKEIMFFLAELCTVIEIGTEHGEEMAAESLRDIYSVMENHPSSNLVYSLLQRQKEINDKFGESDKMSLEDSLLKEMEIKANNQVHGGVAKAQKNRLAKDIAKIASKKIGKAIKKFSAKEKKVKDVLKAIGKHAPKLKAKKAAKQKLKKSPAKKVAKPIKKGAKK